MDLEGYEGPLHLLLDLARRHKIDLVEDLDPEAGGPVSSTMCARRRTQKIDLAADYLLMAAWLGLPEVEAAAAFGEEARGRA